MGYQFSDGAPPTNAPPAFVQGVTNGGNPGAAAVSAALAVEVQQNNATLVLLNGDITYAECAAAPMPHLRLPSVRGLQPQFQWCHRVCSAHYHRAACLLRAWRWPPASACGRAAGLVNQPHCQP